MGSAKSIGRLISATGEHVDGWVREAWADRNSYPNKLEVHALTCRINTIVDRENASPSRERSTNAARKRRPHFVAAQKRARALRGALIPVMEYLHSEREMFSSTGVEINVALASQISAIKEMQRATDAFLDLPVPPKFQDRMDPILCLEQLVKKAWSGVESTEAGKQDSKVQFGKNPLGPLVYFISLVLEGIRLGGDDISLETISDHLRKRQNRARKRTTVTSRVGA